MDGQDFLWGEYFLYNLSYSSLAVGSGLAYVDSEMRIDSDADFSFLKTMYYSTNDNANVTIKYRDDTTGRYLMKAGMSLRTIAGRPIPVDNSGSYDFRPFVWPTPYTIRRATSLTVQAANNHGVISPTVYISFHGSKMYRGLAPWKNPKIRARIPYTYVLTRNLTTIPEGVVQVGANQTVSISLSTDKDSDFAVHKITGRADGDALVQIQEGARDRQWMNTTAYIRNVMGSGAFPNILPSPRFVPKGSVINFTFQDLSGATNNIEFNLSGVKLFS
jgi:hypothetical protein